MPIDAVSQNSAAAAFSGKALSQSNISGKNSSGAADENTREVEKLAQRDRQVRAHEAAHVAAGGQYVRGGATFQYQKGPDGKMYAIGGEVSIDCSPIRGDPEATITKMQAIKRAATAPADPSGQDGGVGSSAAAEDAPPRQEIAKKTGSGIKGPSGTGSTNQKESKNSFGFYNGKGEVVTAPKDIKSPPLDIVA
jgi:hypothetical protein